MKYFIGIVTPDEIKNKILKFQKGIKNNQYPDLFEPHITVKSPGGLTSDLVWVDEMKKRLSGFPCFDIYLEGVGVFEENGVVFVKPHPKEKIKELHQVLFDIIQPIESDREKFFEGDIYHSHLTLGGVKWGLLRDKIPEIKKSAEKEFQGKLEFKVKFIRVYQKEDAAKKYRFLLDIPLS